jgi:hypothetical protein
LVLVAREWASTSTLAPIISDLSVNSSSQKRSSDRWKLPNQAAFIQQSDTAPWHVTRLRGYRNRQPRAGVQLRHIPSLPADRFRADDDDGWPFFHEFISKIMGT